MLLVEQNGVLVFQFPNLSKFKTVAHGIFTRCGGFSQAPFDSLNICRSVGDDIDRVRQNRQRMARANGGGRLIFLHQVHGTDIRVLSRRDRGSDPPAAGGMLTGDALITDIAGLTLVIQVADCQAICLHDPVRHVVANVHSGWRGSVGNIAGRTIRRMQQCFGTRPSDVVAGIGPSLGPCCAEFVNYRSEIPEPLWRYKDGRHHFDFWSLSCDQLRDAGVLRQNILASGICTRCNADLFYSFRRRKRTGRFAAVIGLK